MSFPKQNCTLLNRSCCSDVDAGREGGTDLKTKGELLGREAPGRLLLPAHSKPLKARRPRSQSWQLSVIIPTTPRAPAPGSVSRAGERHLPGSDKMPVFVPAAASRLCGLSGGTASLPASLGWLFKAQPGFLLSPRGKQAQSLPGIYHSGGALLKNTWSPFREISKGIESGAQRWLHTENRAHGHTFQGLISRRVFN